MTLVNIDEVNIPCTGIYVYDKYSDGNERIRSWKYLLQETLGESVAALFYNTFENMVDSDELYDQGYDAGYENAMKEFQKNIKSTI